MSAEAAAPAADLAHHTPPLARPRCRKGLPRQFRRLKEDGIKQLTSYLASSDRQRLTNLSGDQVNDKIKQFQETFKQKYNKDFQPDQTTLADQFKDLTIVQGEVSNPALLSNWPVDATGKSSSTSGGTGSSNLRTDTSSGTSGISSSSSGGIGSSSTSADRSSSSSSSSGLSGSSSSSAAQGTAGSSKVEKGYGLAIVTFPASHGAPEVNVSLIRESSATGATGAAGSNTGTGSSSGSSSTGTGISGSSSSSASPDRFGTSSSAGSNTSADRSSTSSGAAAQTATSAWKIDLPDTMTADKIQTNLAKHLDEVNQMKDQWPTDADHCQKMLAHHIFMALYDVDSSQAGGAGGTRIRGSSSSSGSGSSSGGFGTSGNSAGSSSGTPKQ